MAEDENKKQPLDQSDERFKYIGFEVFPGKAGDIFESEEEHKSLIQKVMTKFGQSEGEVRDGCTLLVERVSSFEKYFLSLIAVVLILSIFFPWFSGHYKITNTQLVPVENTETVSENTDTTAIDAEAAVDTTATSIVTGDAETETPEEISGETIEEPIITEETPALATNEGNSAIADDSAAVVAAVNETTIPPGMIEVIEVTYDNHSQSGIGAMIGLGTYGSHLFSSGIVVMITGILMILFFLSCIGLGGYNLYLLHGVKAKNQDEYALRLKKASPINWIPVILWLFMFFLSFIGGQYGFDSSEMVAQVGESYSMSTFVGLTSFGIFIALGAFLILALKGKEI